jgi:hypothetical protein
MIIRTLSAIAVVTAALASPVFAQDLDGTQKPVHVQRHLRGAYNQAAVNEPSYAASRQSEGWGVDHYGYDRQRIGGEDPDLRPSGN